MHICVNSAIPSMDSIMASFSGLLVYPPNFPSIHLPNIQIPAFPGIDDILNHLPPFPGLPQLPSFMLDFLGLPNPLFGSLRLPNIEFTTIAAALQAFQLQKTLMNMIKPMVDFLGMSLSSFLPSIPGLPGFTLIDLISGNVSALVDALKNSIMNNLHLPNIPSPFFGTLVAKAAEIPHTLMMLTANYLQTVTTAVIGLIKKVTDKLKIAAMPGLPDFPTFDSIMAQLKAVVNDKLASLHLTDLMLNIPDFPGMANVILAKIKAIPGMLNMPSLSLPALLAALGFPGFPAFPMLPDPLIPAFNIPDINFNLGLSTLLNHLTTGLLKPIMDFIENTLKRFLTFEFPLICIDV